MVKTGNRSWGPTAAVNIYIALLLRLAIVMLLFFVSRFIFYALNTEYFPGLTFNRWLNILKGGFRFDLAAMIYINSLFILLQILPLPIRYNIIYTKVSKIIFYLTNGFALLINTIDFIYFRFTLRRSTLSVLDEFANEKGKSSFLWRFLIDYWYVVLVYIVLIIMMVWLYNRIAIKKPQRIRPWLYYPAGLAIMAITITLMVGGIRGDFRHSTRPITMSNAGEYVEAPGEIPLVLNTPFCVIRTSRQTFYKKDTYFPDNQVDAIYTPQQRLSTDKPFKYDNVVVIILESFGKDGIGFYNKHLKNGTYKGFTPFLDSLISVSYAGVNSFANGRKSIDALPSVMAAIPAGEIPFVLTPYASNKIKSLPSVLKEKGYHTSFFHGAPNGSMGFKAIMNLMGVEKYYGKDEYNNDADFDGLWGIWDEPFFQFFARNLDTLPQPFFSSVFSVSSHHPFKVPKKYKGVFPKGEAPIYECMAYTDMALQKFFVAISTKDWFKKTLFVITADHATVSDFPEYQTSMGNMSIPVIFYHPGDTSLRKIDSTVVQQTDIMPSVLSYLNYSGDIVAFGKNIFDPTQNNTATNYMNVFRWVEKNYVLEYSEGTHATTGLFDYANDVLMQKNLKDILVPKRDSMERKIKAYIQQYHNRLLEDRMLPGR
jgi:phosphoglycerol transferase MdoB-like AlkP superfamily enzyme